MSEHVSKDLQESGMDREIDALFDKMRDSTMETETLERADIRPYTNEVVKLVVTKPKGYCVTFIFHGVDYVTHFSNVDLTFKHDGQGNYTVSYDLRKCPVGDMENPMQSTQATFNLDMNGLKQVLCGNMACAIPCFHNMFISLTGYHANIRSFLEYAWKQHRGLNMIVIECTYSNLNNNVTHNNPDPRPSPSNTRPQSVRSHLKNGASNKVTIKVKKNASKKQAARRTRKQTEELTELLGGLQI